MSHCQYPNHSHEIAELKKEISFLKRILALMPGNVYWKNPEGYFLGCNNNAAQILDFPDPTAIIGKTHADLFPSELAQALDETDAKIKSSLKEISIEEYGINEKKQPAFFISKKRPVLDENQQIIGILGISFDISERKKEERELKIAKEKAEASNYAKSQFLAVVNHELRTPLASILGLTELLKNGKRSQADTQLILNHVENCTTHLLNLINEVLDFSKIDANAYNIQNKPVDFIKLIDQVCSITKPLADHKNLQFCTKLSPTLPPFISTDPRALRQVLINLVENAIKFTDAGKVMLSIDVEANDDQNVQLQIRIQDSGCGIPEDKLELIFEPFQQLEHADMRKSSRRGTGLGLAIVKKLADLINIDITVESELGKGSTFYLTGLFEMPTVIVQEEIKNTATHKVKVSQQKPKILLVEDDPIIIYIHSKMLTDLKCDVSAATNGKEALINLDYDLIFVDIMLPDINGFDLITKIRERNKTIPLIASTAQRSKDHKLKSTQSGANELAIKPLSQSRFRKILNTYLENYEK